MSTETNVMAESYDSYVGSRLRLARNICNLSQSALGERVGISFQQIQKYEKGLVRISAGRLAQFANAMSIPVQFFFDGICNDGESPIKSPLAYLDLSQFSETKSTCLQLLASADDEDVRPIIRIVERLQQLNDEVSSKKVG